MVRPSPQTDRVVALIDVLASRPDQALTLAEITRRVGVNKSTCYSMLQALCAAGWILRDPFRKTYRLGPALTAIGRAASVGFPALEFARPAMVELSHALGSHCVALAVAQDHVTVVDQVRDVRAVGAPIGHGFIPLRPPFGAAVVAWAGESAVQGWLDLAPPGARRHYAAALDAARARGYVVELAPSPWVAPAAGASLPEVVEHLASNLPPEVLPTEIDAGEDYAVSAINVPVVGDHGHVVLVVSVMGFSHPLAGSEIQAAGARLSAAASAVSSAIARSCSPTGSPGGQGSSIPAQRVRL